MTYFLIALVCTIAYMILLWFKKRAAYYKQVGEALRRIWVTQEQIDEKYDPATYQARLEFMRKHKLPPNEAAEAFKADINGEENDFMDILNAKAWEQSAPTALKDMDPKHGKQAVENINVSFELCDLFADVLAEKPLPKDEDAQTPIEFGKLITSLVTTMKANKEIQIEPGSAGEKVQFATENEDIDTLSEMQEEIMSEVHRLTGDERARYIFQLFWPQIFYTLNNRK